MFDEIGKQIERWCTSLTAAASRLDAPALPPQPPAGAPPELRLELLARTLRELGVEPHADPERRRDATRRFAESLESGAAGSARAIGAAVASAAEEAGQLLAAGTKSILLTDAIAGGLVSHDGWYGCDFHLVPAHHPLRQLLTPGDCWPSGSFHLLFLGEELLKGPPAWYLTDDVVVLTRRLVAEKREAAERERAKELKREEDAEKRRRLDFERNAVLTRIGQLELEVARLREQAAATT